MNYRLFKVINGLAGSAALDAAMKAAAKYAIVVSFAVLAVLCLQRLKEGRLRPVILTGAGLLVTFVLSLIGARVFVEQRPFQTHRVHQILAHAPGQSFPSDHATAAFGVALAVGVFLSWRWGTVLFLVALLIGFARVYDGIHYPGDIAGGLLAALIGVGVVAALAPLSHSDERDRGVHRYRT